METKKKPSKFKYIFYFLLILFISVYVSGKTGYYETNIKKNTALTSEAIFNFEKDIADGKAVDIQDYINAEVPDYRNVYSKVGDKISKAVDLVLNEGVGKVSRFLKALFT
ncbi:MAG: hypothetical protein PHG03_02130 [Bacilli bacterium]|nr:hypothetical protein [Bacilli bacterium]MDD4795338.1 hypothetical protein [Bacilli bacterium]